MGICQAVSPIPSFSTFSRAWFTFMVGRGGRRWGLFCQTLCFGSKHGRRIARWGWIDWTPTPKSNSWFIPLEEELRETQNSHPIDLYSADSNPLCVKVVEFGPEKTLNINPSLSTLEDERLCNMLREHLEVFAWSYKEMKGVHPSVCTHHMYIKEGCKPVMQPQRRMNLALKDVVKEELQKLVDTKFIYPISDSEWVSPLVLVPKKNGKWRICVDYRELNKATKKDHFPLPFIDQVLDGLARKKCFFFPRWIQWVQPNPNLPRRSG